MFAGQLNSGLATWQDSTALHLKLEPQELVFFTLSCFVKIDLDVYRHTSCAKAPLVMRIALISQWL